MYTLPPQKANAEESSCLTWRNTKNDIQSLYKENLGYSRRLPELPNGF